MLLSNKIRLFICSNLIFSYFSSIDSEQQNVRFWNILTAGSINIDRLLSMYFQNQTTAYKESFYVNERKNLKSEEFLIEGGIQKEYEFQKLAQLKFDIYSRTCI